MVTTLNPLIYGVEHQTTDQFYIRRLAFKTGWYQISGTYNVDQPMITVNTFNSLGMLIPSHYSITTQSYCHLSDRDFWIDLNRDFGKKDREDYNKLGRALVRV